MKKAILVAYCCDQNEPSRPLPHIFLIPDHIGIRNALLKKLLVTEFNLLLNDETPITITKGNADDYGDLVVAYGDEMFLFVTFIKD